MISPNDFRKGTSFEMNGEVYEIIDFQHVKPGKGAAFVRAKIRNVINGTTKDTTFNPSDKYPQARIETKEMQYLYNDGEIYYFMDPESFEQLPISASIAQDAMKYVKDSENATIKFYQGEAFSVEPPNFVELEVTQTEPGIKGDTATGATKHAVVETGAELQVPLFIEIGDIIRIDTRDNEYQSRV